MRQYVRKSLGDLRSKTAEFLFIKNHADILDLEILHIFFFVFSTPEYEILAEGEPELN